jgi:hypothetical protein
MFECRLFASLVFLGALTLSTLALAADPMGSVVAVEGRPTAAGASGSRALSAGSDVFEGDTITVGDGNAQMQLDDGTKLVVGPSSRLVLQSYLRRGSSTASKVSVKALRGTFRFITGKSPKSAYKISTSNATIGIRGTGFDFTVDNRTVMAVLKGAVRLRGKNGQAVDTASGCGVAEAGSSSFKAKVLAGKPKSNALQNELPYISDQSALDSQFQLPVGNCLPFILANSGVAPVPPVVMALPLIPAAVLAGSVLHDGGSPVSAGDTPPPPPPPVLPPICMYYPQLPVCNP